MMANRLTEEEALLRLRGLIAYDFRQKDMAKLFGVSVAFVSMVLRGDKRPTEAMLAHIGLRRASFIEEMLGDGNG